MSPKLRVILCDDDVSFLFLLERMVRKTYPAAVIVAFDNGYDALIDYQQSKADLIITDCGMPHMDGPTLVTKLREQQACIPIILISSSEQDKTRALRAGATLFFDKSAALRQLPQILPDYLR